MTDDERKERARWARQNRSEAREKGICTRCGKSFQPNGRALCPNCRVKMDAILEKVRKGR